MATGYALSEDAQREIFACPVCGRPLGQGTGRCPGCGTRLILEVPAKRAGAFIAIGLAIGLLVGGTLTGLAVATSSPAATIPGSVSRSGSGPTPASGSIGATGAAVPIAAASALRLTATIGDRLALNATTLRAQLRAAKFDTVAGATTLRSIASGAAWGSDVIVQLQGWSDADRLRLELSDYYGSLRRTALGGLSASITNTSAYRTAARRMLALIDTRNSSIRSSIELLALYGDVSLPAQGATPAPQGP